MVNGLAATDAAVSGNENEFTEIHGNSRQFRLCLYYVQICLSSKRYCIATERRPITRPFHPTDDEHKLYETVSEFLLRDDTFSIPVQQRSLTALILRKLLASSSHAIAGTRASVHRPLGGHIAGNAPGHIGSHYASNSPGHICGHKSGHIFQMSVLCH